jgi:transcriptional regulator with XRE-family HTH domain
MDWKKEIQQHKKQKPDNNSLIAMLRWKIKYLRLQNRMTQKDLGFQLGLSDKAICAYEGKGTRNLPPISTLIRLAEVFNVPVAWFLKRPQKNQLKRDKMIKRLQKIRIRIEKMEDILNEVEIRKND